MPPNERRIAGAGKPPSMPEHTGLYDLLGERLLVLADAPRTWNWLRAYLGAFEIAPRDATLRLVVLNDARTRRSFVCCPELMTLQECKAGIPTWNAVQEVLLGVLAVRRTGYAVIRGCAVVAPDGETAILLGDDQTRRRLVLLGLSAMGFRIASVDYLAFDLASGQLTALPFGIRIDERIHSLNGFGENFVRNDRRLGHEWMIHPAQLSGGCHKGVCIFPTRLFLLSTSQAAESRISACSSRRALWWIQTANALSPTADSDHHTSSHNDAWLKIAERLVAAGSRTEIEDGDIAQTVALIRGVYGRDPRRTEG